MMSKQTPRKPRHTRHPSNRIPAVSDYESDNPIASGNNALQPAYDYAPPPPDRTNTDLNLSVIQRYLPSIHTILSIAANAVIYTFDPENQRWDKSGIEGTMFVCVQNPLPGDPQQRPRACVFILNRRGLENLPIDLAMVSDVEVLGELVILKVEGSEGYDENGDDGVDGEEKVLGIWVHNDKTDTREVNAATINECWKIARVAGRADELGPEAGPAMQAIGGGRLTVDDLFKSQNGANAAQ
jgi:hypothetical protein